MPFDFRRSYWGHHLNFRDPDNIAVELVLLRPDADVRAVLDRSSLETYAFSDVRFPLRLAARLHPARGGGTSPGRCCGCPRELPVAPGRAHGRRSAGTAGRAVPQPGPARALAARRRGSPPCRPERPAAARSGRSLPRRRRPRRVRPPESCVVRRVADVAVEELRRELAAPQASHASSCTGAMQRRVVRAGELGEADAVGERGVRRHGEPQPHLQIDGRWSPAVRRECVRQVGVVGRNPAFLSARCALQQRRGDLPSLRTLIGGHGQQQLAAVSQCGADQGPAGSDVATRVLSGHRAGCVRLHSSTLPQSRSCSRNSRCSSSCPGARWLTSRRWLTDIALLLREPGRRYSVFFAFAIGPPTRCSPTS